MGGPRRRSLRLQGFDYSQPGAYFVTMCTDGRRPLFGEVLDNRVVLAPAGKIVAQAWEWLADQYTSLELDAWVLMPNHLHGILVIHDDAYLGIGRGGSRPSTCGFGQVTAPTPSIRKPIGSLVGAFKTVSTKDVNVLRGRPGARLWQRGYYERVLRDEGELRRARNYIINNPAQRSLDRENPDRRATA